MSHKPPSSPQPKKHSTRSKTSAAWLQRHVDDPYVKQSKIDGYRSRATYKLLEMQEKDMLIKPGMTIIDVGAAPGGWSQAARKILGDTGRVIALDILEMDKLSGVEFIQGDFREPEVLEALLAQLGDDPVDLIISDLAANTSGNKSVDQPRMMYLAELGLDLCQQVLKPGGNFLLKIFQGQGFDQYLQLMRSHFTQVSSRKPQASRAQSKECYLLGRGFKR